MNRLVQHRGAEPDDVLGVVVFDLSRFRLVQRNVMRRKMTVRDGVIVAVSRELVDMLRRQRRRECQERRHEQQSDDAGQPDHKEIIGGM
jgi:hypothetical protein